MLARGWTEADVTVTAPGYGARVEADLEALRAQGVALDGIASEVLAAAARLSSPAVAGALPGFGLVAALGAARDQWRAELEGLGDRCAVAAGHLHESADAYGRQDRGAAEGFWTTVR